MNTLLLIAIIVIIGVIILSIVTKSKTARKYYIKTTSELFVLISAVLVSILFANILFIIPYKLPWSILILFIVSIPMFLVISAWLKEIAEKEKNK